ncbi:hypothetical protein [Natrinema sp. 74]|uniref:hypothetical protein n=1 Tax=Natrinema sp. 74 TaxID=3384159 RepID=UPI0038D3FC42
MSRWRDDRAVTVQIGAVLLLAIVFAALALYQVNAVPAENQAIESEHNRQVHNELQEVRNAIRNVGINGGSASVSVTLGTQYPTRTFLTNPPDPTGSLETTGTANVTLENATFSGDRAAYDGDPSSLVRENYTTTSLVYRPDYNEYRSAPTTRIEHGFAYNEFANATVSLTDQGLINDGTIRLILLNGSLSTSGQEAVSLDPTILSGPSDPVPITGTEGSGNITLAIPTQAPSAWNETIGTAFDTGEENTRVVGYADGTLRIEFADQGEPYDLQLARVGIGDSSESSDEFDITTSETGGGAYDVYWASSHDTVRQCADSDPCDYAVYSGETATFNTNSSAESADLDFAYRPNDSAEVTVSTFDERNQSVDFQADGSGLVDLFVSSGGNSDTITVRVEHDELPPSIDRFDVTSQNQGTHARFTVDWKATAGDAGITRGRLELIDSSGTVVDSWQSTYSGASSVTETGISLEDKHGAGNDYDIRLTVSDSNGNDRSETVTRTG